MNSLGEVLQESVTSLSKSLVTQSDFERNLFTYKVDFTSLRSEIALLEKNDLALLKADISRLLTEVEKLKTRQREDMNALQSTVRLDLSLEKGKIRDEQSFQEIRIKEVESKIDTEVSNFQSVIESMKWEMFRTLIRRFQFFDLSI